ncbi:MAG: hypothetical protein Kow00120_16160 [Anaerolineae bacterium]
MALHGGRNRERARVPRAVAYLPPRILDSIPGFLAWASLVLIIIGAIREPRWVLTVVAALGIYMAVRFVLGGVGNALAMRRIARWETVDWRAEYQRRRKADSLAWEAVHHVAIIPNYKEAIAKLRATLQRLAEFPDAPRMLTVVLAMEADDPGARSTFEQLHAEFAGRFARVIYSSHPYGLPGESTGKAFNEAWAARLVKQRLVDDLGYPIDNLIVTVLDADSRLHTRYLEALTCLFATDPARWRVIWQSPARYHNNVWDVPAPISLLHVYSSAWETAYLAAPWWFSLPYSTYSISLRLLHEVGYWNAEPEDQHIFTQCYFHHGGSVHVRPLYLPFSCDATTGTNLLDAFRARYKQTARHTWWGVKEISYTTDQIVGRRKGVPWLGGAQLLMQLAHDQIMAGAGWVIMTLGAQLSFLLHPRLLVFDSPQMITLSVAMGIVTLMGFAFWVMDWAARPPRTRPWTWKERLALLVSFPLLPVLTVIALALPVLEAQTRLLLDLPPTFGRMTRKH